MVGTETQTLHHLERLAGVRARGGVSAQHSFRVREVRYALESLDRAPGARFLQKMQRGIEALLSILCFPLLEQNRSSLSPLPGRKSCVLELSGDRLRLLVPPHRRVEVTQFFVVVRPIADQQCAGVLVAELRCLEGQRNFHTILFTRSLKSGNRLLGSHLFQPKHAIERIAIPARG